MSLFRIFGNIGNCGISFLKLLVNFELNGITTKQFFSALECQHRNIALSSLSFAIRLVCNINSLGRAEVKVMKVLFPSAGFSL